MQSSGNRAKNHMYGNATLPANQDLGSFRWAVTESFSSLFECCDGPSASP